MYLFRLLVLIAFLLPLGASAEGINAGFVQGLWYSHDPFFADEEVRIYAALRNNAEGDLTGTVQFLDNGELIRERRVSAVSGNVVDTWVDWTPEYGEHTIEAILTNVVLDGSDEQNATVTARLAEDVRFVDHDTDGDGIGNEEDADDDGDGIPDEEEIQNGTDPLVFDEPSQSENENTERENGEATTTEGDPSETSDEAMSNEPSGFESFLENEGVTKDVLTGITSVSNRIGNAIDRHREERAAQKTAEETPDTEARPPEEVGPPGSSTDNGSEEWQSETSLGEVTRTQGEPRKKRIDLAGFFSSLIDKLYSGVLFVLSFYFAHPGLVQFTLLFLLLVVLYRTMRRLAKRPQD